MPEPIPELTLAWCLLLTTAPFAAAAAFAARRTTAVRSQVAVDAVVLGFAVQYAAVGLPGMVGLLRPGVVATVALTLSAILATLAVTAPKRPRSVARPRPPLAVLGFAAAFVVAFAVAQNVSPVMANDALTYHFPAAVQWIQTGRIGLFPTWFFNPANTYSPLAGSTFIAWLMLPFGSDVLARFVEVPASLGLLLAVYALARLLRLTPTAAALTAAAAALARPFLTATMMGKDDLFVALFFVAALLALHPDRARERLGPARLGVAVGLLLATKYTALLAAPLLAIAASRIWRPRPLIIAGTVAALLAGPWYVRNAVLTGNPLFPVRVASLPGLFTTARSLAFVPLRHASRVAVGGQYGLPTIVVVVVVIGWLAAVVRAVRTPRPLAAGDRTPASKLPGLSDPLARTCVFGPPIGLALFYGLSPFPEIRFLFPTFALGFVAAAYGFRHRAGAALLFAASVATASTAGSATFVATAAVIVAVAAAFDLGTKRWPPVVRVGLSVGGPALLLAAAVYAWWPAYVRDRRELTYGPDSPWAAPYAAELPTWRWVDEHVPPEATIAYAGSYYPYPLQGSALRRRVLYVPTRHGVRTMADLPYLGDRLPGERIVPATTAAMVADADEAEWLTKLAATGATYLVIFTNGGDVPERRFAEKHRERFIQAFADAAGRVYRIDR